MEFFPIFLNLKRKPVLVVGGGEVAYRKVTALKKAGAQLTVVSPSFHPLFGELSTNDSIRYIENEFHPYYLDHQYLVVSATDDPQVNTAVYQAATQRRIFVTTVDDLKRSSAIFPAVVDRSPIMIAISSAGKAPVLVRKIKQQLETWLPQSLGQLGTLAGEYRVKVKERLHHFSARRWFWEDFFQRFSPFQHHREADVRVYLESELQNPAPKKGHVALVGAGPGDPELLTLKALQVMQSADVIVHDRLVSDAVLAYARKDADYISVGKTAGHHCVPQKEINQILVDLAKEGKVVCRLKGGDPFIFGRGGEEAETLHQQGVAFSIVPGITAASGCSAYAGIPLTHRDHAQHVHIVTGHRKDDSEATDWQALAQSNQTLVIYMGLLRAEVIQQQLITHGRAKETPVAIVENGTRDNQRVISGTLNELSQLIQSNEVGSPGLIIVGEVVALQQSLQWFKQDQEEKQLETINVQGQVRAS